MSRLRAGLDAGFRDTVTTVVDGESTGGVGQVDSASSQCSPTTLSQPNGFASAEFRESRQVFHSVTNWFTSNTPCRRWCGRRVAAPA